MYKEIEETTVVQTIGDYTIVKSVEQVYLDNGKKSGEPETWYDICLGNEEGDIVYSCDKLNEARKWAKES